MTNHKYHLGFFPTPIHQLEKLSKIYSNYNIYIKRDDQTGLASGGNKTRKLEYLIRQALDKDSDIVITAGAQQSNHCRQTAAACAVAGIECHLMLRGTKPEIYQGNLLLSHLLGAKIHFTGNDKKEIDLKTLSKKLAPKKSYIIPYGGSNITGAMGFVDAVKELKQQLNKQNLKIDYIFLASSSGGTQAGLMLGMELYNLDIKLIPIKIDKSETNDLSLEEAILKILTTGCRLLNIKKEFNRSDIKLNKNYNQAEYGVLTHREKLAINELAKHEGILLDPVYTGRAFYGMMDILKQKILQSGSNVLFWHTGGLPALFEYAKDF